MSNESSLSGYDAVLLTGAGVESWYLLNNIRKRQKLTNLLSVFVRMSDNDGRHQTVAESQALSRGAGFHVVEARPMFFGLHSSGLSVRKDRGRYVPGYRQILLSIGCQIADYVGADELYIGEHAEWAEGHPSQILFEKMVDGNTTDGELNPEFWHDLVAIYNATYKTTIELCTPLMGYTKDQVVGLAHKEGLDLLPSLTCRRPKPENAITIWHCGQPDCFFCVSRRLAFKDAGVTDPTVYGVNP